jgi:hypothetical protein
MTPCRALPCLALPWLAVPWALHREQSPLDTRASTRTNAGSKPHSYSVSHRPAVPSAWESAMSAILSSASASAWLRKPNYIKVPCHTRSGAHTQALTDRRAWTAPGCAVDHSGALWPTHLWTDCPTAHCHGRQRMYELDRTTDGLNEHSPESSAAQRAALATHTHRQRTNACRAQRCDS